jgi:sarcosine oxidase subunit beta
MTVMKPIPKSAAVVVIGGGIVGASALYHLAQMGCTDVVLLEQETLASGSTGKASGGIRTQFSDLLNAQIGMECLRRYARFSDEFDMDIDFRRCGYLFLLTRDEEVVDFDRDLLRQAEAGCATVRLDRSQTAALVPNIETRDVIASNWGPEDAVATPEAAVQGYATAARRLGARVVQGCTVRSILVDKGHVTGVETSHGRITAPAIVLAAGFWSHDLAATAGIEIPVSPQVRHVFFTEPCESLAAKLPVTIDYATGIYFKAEGTSILFGGPGSALEDLAPAALHRMPGLGDVGIRGGWSGAYDMSPDGNAIVGKASEITGFVYATGFSGHGFMQGPVIGEHLASLALGLPTHFDLTSLSAERFAAGELRKELHVI